MNFSKGGKNIAFLRAEMQNSCPSKPSTVKRCQLRIWVTFTVIIIKKKDDFEKYWTIFATSSSLSNFSKSEN
jgi:hypothetical protein